MSRPSLSNYTEGGHLRCYLILIQPGVEDVGGWSDWVITMDGRCVCECVCGVVISAKFPSAPPSFWDEAL